MSIEGIRPPSRFVGLHCHSGTGSPFDGLGYPNQHMDFIISNGMDSWALTDHGNGNGLSHAHAHAKKLAGKGKKFRQLYGVEFYFVQSLDGWRDQYNQHMDEVRIAREEKKKLEATDINSEDEIQGGLVVEDEDDTKSRDTFAKDEWKRRYHLVVFAKNQKGLQNLFTLVKRSYKEGFYRFPRIDLEMLKTHGEGLVVSTACIGGIFAAQAIRGEALNKPFEEIQREMQNLADRFVDAVGIDNFNLEIQFNSLPMQHLTNRHLFELAKKTGIKLVATGDSHYYGPDLWEARELYKRLGRMGQRGDAVPALPKFEDLKCELYPKNAQQMWDEYLKHYDGYDFYKGNEEIVRDAIERTYDIAWDQCEEIWFDKKAKLPDFGTAEKTAFEQLKILVDEGMKKEGLDKNPEYVERIKMEMDDIEYLGFENYFLTLTKVFTKAKDRTLIGPGRGSGAGSLVNYVLGITHVDPVKYDLLWERFLGRHKVAWPDIDTDVGNRDVLIDVSRELFGDDSVIPVSNFSTLKLKSLIKDVSKFYNIPFEEVNEMTGPLQDEVMHKAMGDHEEKSTYVLSHDDCLKYSEKYRDFMEKYPVVAEKIKILFMEPRSIGRHASGVLVCPDLEKHMPVIGVRGELQTPWSEGMNFRHLEENGFLKFDYLGLSLLQMVEDCIRLILRNQGNKNPSFDQINAFFDEHLSCRNHAMDDQKVWKHVYHEGRFTQVFQFANAGARKFCLEAKPVSIDDLSAITAIYRPGPLAANVHKKYVKAGENLKGIRYAHPVIKSILESTRGFVIYQEQFMLLAQKLSGFNPGESDQMRKTLVKKSLDMNEKKAKEREDLRKRFIGGAMTLNGMAESPATELYETIEAFSAYGFNKSHSVSYAIDSYYAAWLHTYYEKEWLATCLQSEINSPEGMAKVISEIKEQGFKILPPDINFSADVWVYSEARDGFIPPLTAIKGVGNTAVEEIMAMRPYSSVYHLLYDEDGEWKHSKVNKTTFDSLCKVEAFHSLEDFKEGRVRNHKILHEAILGSYDSLRKGKYGMTKAAIKKMEKAGDLPKILIESLLRQGCDDPDWSRSEKIDFSFGLMKSVDEDLLFPPKIMKKIDKAAVPSVAEISSKGKHIVWMCIQEFEKKETKNGKVFYRVKATDKSNKSVNVRLWGEMGDDFEPYTMWVSEISYDEEWGISSNANKMRKLDV
jgi:DNA polymerase-3 subunit alpha